MFITAAIIIGILAIIGLMDVRNDIIYSVRMKATNYVFSTGEWQKLRHELDKVSYDEMFWQLRKWTFKQFYPELA